MEARIASQEGFTLIETLVASVVLVVGLFSMVGLLDVGQAFTTGNATREQAVALERELVEAARSIPYDQLTPNSAVGLIQAKPELGDDDRTQDGWQIRRRNATFSVSVGVCTVDD